MPRSLPPLNWFLAFECSAKHLNFTAAATELNITQSAVRQQIRLLEARLETVLFSRKARGLALTDSGRRLLPSISKAIEHIREGIVPFDNSESALVGKHETLKVACSSSFSMLWLAPRLTRFLSIRPNAEVHIVNTLWPDDYISSDADVEIRFGSKELVGESAEILMSDILVPICLPAIASTINSWSELCTLPLVQTVGASDTWKTYAEDLGLEIPPASFCSVDSSMLAIEVAKQSGSIALVYKILADKFLSSNEMALAMDIAAPARDNHYIKLDASSQAISLQKSFRDWIFSEIG